MKTYKEFVVALQNTIQEAQLLHEPDEVPMNRSIVLPNAKFKEFVNNLRKAGHKVVHDRSAGTMSVLHNGVRHVDAMQMPGGWLVRTSKEIAKMDEDALQEDGSPVGKHVGFGYRGAHPHGRVTGVFKKGTTRATTEYDIMPDAKDRHPGEKLPVHRMGNKIHEETQA